MAALTLTTRAEDLGLAATEVEAVAALLAERVADGTLHGGVLGLARCGVLHLQTFGSSPPPNANNTAGLRDALPIVPDSIFLVASVTKPVTCCAVMQLVDKGLLSLDQKVVELLPEFGRDGAAAPEACARVTLRHLLTHTSGLPDGIPENQEYRQRLAPLADFTRRMCKLPLAFPAGTDISYQSAGINLLAEIVQRVSGEPLPAYLRRHIFGPLGMHDTSLARVGGGSKAREIACNIDEGGGQTADQAKAVLLTSNSAADAHCNWNSDYWRGFGAPWGGMTTTAADYSSFLQAFIYGGALLSQGAAVRIIEANTATQMVTDQTTTMEGMSPSSAAEQAYGLGWRLNGSAAAPWGQRGGERVFGHGGATGASVFADPASGLSVCLFTTEPTLGTTTLIPTVRTDPC
jgi:CubicO group peptidase (beta-lactamase class C family)